MNREKPSPGAIREARNHPNGWVYEIDGEFGDDEVVPPEAIVGAWQVSAEGEIVGSFIPNPRYKGRGAGQPQRPEGSE